MPAMPSRRKDPTPTEVDSDSDVEVNLDFPQKPTKSISEAMKSIDKWKSKRSEVQKGIGKDFTDKLTALTNKINSYYQDEMQRVTSHDKQQLERLIMAFEKRMDCEEKIGKQIDSLREDCAHIAMLMDAVYTGRKEAATQSAKAFKPGTPQK
ncbi:hypothetical protein F5Y04DRAFT_58102 [Hypomontagnella monticulosa]|nr:hypothetical protein F5Y04DRAFT_58102 [Hypomontagnella monticulosa]